MSNPNFSDFFNIADKIILISGAGSGIGEAVAKRLSKAGAIVIVADLNEAAAGRVVSEITATGGTAVARTLDVTDAASCDAVAAWVQSTYSRSLDVLVNSAGIGFVGTMLETKLEDLERLNKVNLNGTFNLSKAFLPQMIAAGRGSMIPIASVCGVLAVPDRLAYNTTKYAVVGLVKSMALDHAKTGVRFNAICPARVLTPFVEARIQEYPDPQKAFKEMSESQPVGRMASPEEIAAAVHYFASDESSFVTGTAFCIDGGYSVGH